MKIVIHPEYQFASKFISSLPMNFDTEGETIYKGRNVVKRFHTSYGDWIVKQYKKPNFIQQLAYTFWRKSKAERAFLYAGKLLSSGIDTPQGIGYIETQKNGLLCTCYFISTVCQYPPLYQPLVVTPQFNKELASSLAAFFVEMHSKGFLHGDPNLENLLYHTDAQSGRFLFSVIDTNRSIFKSPLTMQECLENLKRTTHRRDLLEFITHEYATLRQWDTSQSIQYVMNALDKFEKKRRIKRFFKFSLS